MFLLYHKNIKIKLNGGRKWIRTNDLLIKSEMLFQLSYTSKKLVCQVGNSPTKHKAEDLQSSGLYYHPLTHIKIERFYFC